MKKVVWWWSYKTQGCACGNGPLTRDDLKKGGQCKCCRDGHSAPHDIASCVVCGNPDPWNLQVKTESEAAQ